MPTHRLSLSDPHPVMYLNGSHTEPVQQIEVPAGETEYRLDLPSDIPHPRSLVFHLRHPDSVARLGITVTAGGETAPSLQTAVIHHAPRTRAETIVRTLSRDDAAPRYTGLIRIEEGANGSESYLTHNSLLLGSSARSWSLPSLEIKADDVKCSHAATMRTISEPDLFYLRSRGLSPTESSDTLILAFLQL